MNTVEQSKQGAVTVIRCGELLAKDRIAAVSEALECCLHKGIPMAVLDLQNTQLIDSEGLELLLDTSEQFRRRGGAVKLAMPTDLCAEILSLTMVEQEIQIFDNSNQAVRSFVR